MLTSQKVIDAINEQIGYEFSAELQYYAIGAHFASEALPQLAQHFFQQAEEEKGHALRFIKVRQGTRSRIPQTAFRYDAFCGESFASVFRHRTHILGGRPGRLHRTRRRAILVPQP